MSQLPISSPTDVTASDNIVLDAANNKDPQKNKRSIVAKILLWLLAICAIIFIVLGIIGFRAYQLAATEAGTQRLLGLINEHQQILHYERATGTLRDGLTLNKLQLKFKAMHVEVDKATVILGWRSLLSKQVHLKTADIGDLKIIKLHPPTDTPFAFDPIKMPYALRVDSAKITSLTIVTPTKSDIVLYNIKARDTTFINDMVSLHHGQIEDKYFRADQLNGTIQFTKKYPLNVTGNLVIPALERQKLDPFKLEATGDLAHIKAKAKMNWPDLATAVGDVYIFEKNIPYTAQVYWDDFRLPWATSEHMRLQKGKGVVSGNEHGANIHIDTDLSGKHVPAGHYQAETYTNWQGIDIKSLTAKILEGALTGNGHVDWAKEVTWQLQGTSQDIHIHTLVPNAAHVYLPNKLTSQWQSTAALGSDKSNISAIVQQFVIRNGKPTVQGGEKWQVNLSRKGSIGDDKQPLIIDTAWQNLHNQVAGIGQVFSPTGSAHIQSHADKTNIVVDTQLVQPAKSANANTPKNLLPSGRYQANILMNANAVDISDINYAGAAGQLQGNSRIQLATSTKNKASPLVWQADLKQVNIDPRFFVPALPLKRVVGALSASGTVAANQQQMAFKHIKLTVDMAETNPTKTTKPVQKSHALEQDILQKPASVVVQDSTVKQVQLSGDANVGLFFSQKSGKSIFSSYAVKFLGDLNAPHIPTGLLDVTVSGTPDLLKIDHLHHQGAAGQINAVGSVFLNQLRWDMMLDMQHFNPHFLLADISGDLSGTLNTQGEWNSLNKKVSIKDTDVRGSFNRLPLLLQGQVDVDLADFKRTALLDSIQTQGLQLVLGKNKVVLVQNATGLQASLNVMNLTQLYPPISGQLIGTISLDSIIKNQANVDLLAKNIQVQTFATDALMLRGTIALDAMANNDIVLDVKHVRMGDRLLSHATAHFNGQLDKHVLQLNVGEKQQTALLNLSGTLSPQWDWQGVLLDGKINANGHFFTLSAPSNLAWHMQQKQLQMAAHCWQGTGHLCLTEPLLASPEQGIVVVNLVDLDVHDLQDFMPVGMYWLGAMNGGARVTWQKDQSPTLDAEIHTDNGSIGLTADDPQDPPLIIPYNRLSLFAKTQPEGLKIRFDMKTPAVGTGYVDAMIDPKVTPKTINGALVLDKVEASVFKVFFPNMRTLSGQGSLAGGMSGPLTSPDFYGEFKFNNGKVVASTIPLALSNISIKSSIRGTKATLAGSFDSGGGLATINGNLDWAAGFNLKALLTGDKLLIKQPPMLLAHISPKINVDFTPEQRLLILRGNIDVPDALVTPPPSVENAVQPSADVRLINQETIASTKANKTGRPWKIDTDLSVRLGDSVFFKGFGANAKLGLEGKREGETGGVFTLKQSSNEGFKAEGKVMISHNENIRAFGQSMTLRRGAVAFNGPISRPELDIEAFKIIDSRTLGLSIAGSPTKPVVAMFNDAGLTEQETISALITGRINTDNTNTTVNQSGFKSDINNTLAAAGISLGLSGSRQITGAIGRRFGLSDLTLDAEAAGTDTQVNVTGYITPDLYLRYGRTVFEPVTKLTLRYQVNRKLYLEASSAIDKAVDVFYNWKF